MGRTIKVSEKTTPWLYPINGGKPFKVYARGTRGEPLLIAGTNAFTGGRGVSSADEMFGGFTTNGKWTSGIIVSQRWAELIAQTIRHSDYGTASDVGLINFECTLFLKDLTANTANHGKIGLYSTGADNWFCVWQLYTDAGGNYFIKPYTFRGYGGGESWTGTGVSINEEEIYRLRITLDEDGKADFYINGTIVQTKTSTSSVPYDKELQGYIGLTTTGKLFVKRAKIQFG
jgi:hypothetical protein